MFGLIKMQMVLDKFRLRMAMTPQMSVDIDTVIWIHRKLEKYNTIIIIQVPSFVNLLKDS